MAPTFKDNHHRQRLDAADLSPMHSGLLSDWIRVDFNSNTQTD